MSIRSIRVIRVLLFYCGFLQLISCFAANPLQVCAQSILVPTVSLRTTSNLKLIPRFDNDTLYLRVWDKHGAEKAAIDSSDLA